MAVTRLEVKRPADLYHFEKRNSFGGTQRQLICVVIAAVLGVAVWISSTYLLHINDDIVMLLLALIVVPAGLLGFFHPKGLHFEVYLRMRLKQELTPPLNKLIEIERMRCNASTKEWCVEYTETGKERRLRRRIFRKEVRRARRLLFKGKESQIFQIS